MSGETDTRVRVRLVCLCGVSIRGLMPRATARGVLKVWWQDHQGAGHRASERIKR